jgi:hypothetical protein
MIHAMNMKQITRKMKNTVGLVAIIIVAMLSGRAVAQQKGEVKDQEFIIRKDRVLTLPNQPRQFERIPVLPVPKSSSSFNYEVKPFFLNLAPVELKSEAAQKQFPKTNDEIYSGFARLGYGNYGSPLIEGRFNSWEEEEYNFGVKLKHESFAFGPVRGRDSGEAITGIGVDGTWFQDFFQLYGGLDFDHHRFNFYGFDPFNPVLEDFITTQNILKTFRLNAGIQNLEKNNGLNYDLGLAIRRFNDNFAATENEILVRGTTDYWFDDYLKADLRLDLSLTNPTDVFYRNINRNYFRISPGLTYHKEGLRIKAGANMIFENDVTTNKRSDFHVFPNIQAHYMISDEFGIYAGFEGDVIRKTYYDFVMENQFLGPSERLLNTIQNFQASAGVKGTINGEINYKAGVNVGKFSNMHFFGNSAADSLRFNLLFDTETRVINYSAQMDWEHKGWYKLLAKANYYQYNTGTLAAAFQRPEWEFALNNNFTPAEKWLIQANANFLGGIQGFNLGSDAITMLPVIIDLQLKVDYQITDRISAFAIGNNLLNRTNQRFLNYPVRGIQGIVGATMRF